MRDHSAKSHINITTEIDKPGEIKIHNSMVHNHDNHTAAVKVKMEASHNNYDQHNGHSSGGFKKRLVISLILTIPILLLSHMIREFFGIHEVFQFKGDQYLLFVFASILFFYGGMPFLKGFYREMKKFEPGMMTLISIAVSTAYFYSSAVVFGLEGEDFFWELATLIDIMLLGHWLEMRSIQSASRALSELQKLLPDNVTRLDKDGLPVEINFLDMKNGDILLVKPGGKIPADGFIVEGRSSLNESMITGESAPVQKEKGDAVTGGSVNGEGSLKIKVQKTGDETFLSQVVKLVNDARQSKSKIQDLANRAAFWLTLIAVSAGAITMFVWLVFAGADFNFALSRTVTVMIIACPHALGLAIPLVVSVSTALSAKKGLLIRNRTAFERARNTGVVVFDKTGTLTKGEFGITKVVSFTKTYNEDEVLRYAASVEAESEHPVAKAISAAGKFRYPVTQFNAIPGRGAEGEANGHHIKVVSPGYLKERGIQILEADNADTTVYLLVDDEPAGSITLSDIVREESKEAIQELNSLGIKTIMLTGDNRYSAGKTAAALGIDEYFAEVLPADKAGKIKEVQASGLITAMTGDGVNDAPALASADIGIAIGAGTDVAVETADIVLVRSNPKDVVTLIKFARAAYRKMIQNLLWATGYNIIAIPLAAGVLYPLGITLSPALGAVLMSVSTIIVAINARMLKIK